MAWWSRMKTLSALEGYNLWAKTYHAEANPIKKMSDDFIAENLPALNGKSVLDAGCGTGKICAIAVDRGALSVKGIDLSPVMIEEAKKNCPRASFECNDLSKASIENYDVIICGLVLGHIETHEPVLKKLTDGLKPGGTIVITDFHPGQVDAKRTFKDNSSGKTFAIRNTHHLIEDYFSLLKKFGVSVNVFNEPLYAGKPVIFGISGMKS